MLNTIYNESGAFFVDGHGVLRKFECGEKNNSRLPYRPDCKYLLTLHIPEGVRVIPKHFFCGILREERRDLPGFSGDDGEGMERCVFSVQAGCDRSARKRLGRKTGICRMSYPPGGCGQGKVTGDAVQVGPWVPVLSLLQPGSTA